MSFWRSLKAPWSFLYGAIYGPLSLLLFFLLGRFLSRRVPLFARIESFLCSKPRHVMSKSLEPYGETPYIIWHGLKQQLGIKEGDRLLELGAGRFLGAFWLSCAYQCAVMGLEREKPWVERARALTQKRWIQEAAIDVRARELDLQLLRNPSSQEAKKLLEELELFRPHWIYYYGVGTDELLSETLMLWITHTQVFKNKTRLIAVGTQLLEGHSALERCIHLRMPWGRSKAYIYRL